MTTLAHTPDMMMPGIWRGLNRYMLQHHLSYVILILSSSGISPQVLVGGWIVIILLLKVVFYDFWPTPEQARLFPGTKAHKKLDVEVHSLMNPQFFV